MIDEKERGATRERKGKSVGGKGKQAQKRVIKTDGTVGGDGANRQELSPKTRRKMN